MNFKEVLSHMRETAKDRESPHYRIVLWLKSIEEEGRTSMEQIEEVISTIRFCLKNKELTIEEIRRALRREQLLKERGHKGGRRHQIRSIIETLKYCRKKGYTDEDLLKSLKENWGYLSRTSKWRIRKELKL